MKYFVITRHYQRPIDAEQVEAYIENAQRRTHHIQGGLMVVDSKERILFRVLPKINRRDYIDGETM